MTIKTLWTILIKIFGLWFLFVGLATMVQLLSMFIFAALNGGSQSTGKILLALAILFLTAFVFIFILWLLVFKTAWVIKKFKLTNGFTEDSLEQPMEWKSIITIATIVTGGVIFIDSFPLLFKQILTFIQRGKSLSESQDSIWILLYLIKTVLGYLLITNSRFVVSFIGRQNLNNRNDQINDTSLEE